MPPKPRVTVVGSSNIDHVVLLPHLPAVGQTVLGGAYLQAFGGKGANQAVAAARLGADAAFVTCVGDDPLTAEMLRSFDADGIDLGLASRLAGRVSGVALVLVDGEGNNYLAVDSGANADLTVADVERAGERIAASSVLVLQNEVPAAATLRAADIALEAGVRRLLNYAPFGPGLEGAATDLLVVNESEATGLTGIGVGDPASATEAAQRARRLGFAEVVVTLGAGGALVADASGETHVPARRVAAIDTTAAGDTFCGALAVALAEGRSLREAARFATAAAALCVSAAGAQPSIPRRGAVDDLLG